MAARRAPVTPHLAATVSIVAALCTGCIDGSPSPIGEPVASARPEAPASGQARRGEAETRAVLDLLASNEARQRTQAALAQAVRRFPEPCARPGFRWTETYRVMSPLQVEAGVLRRGAFITSYRVIDCPHDRVVNLLYSLAENGDVRAIEMLPGTSIAEPLLQRDVTTSLIAPGGALQAPNCRDTRIIDTRFDGFTGALAADALIPGQRPWSETWTVLACGAEVPAKIEFQPNAGGTAFQIRWK